MNKFAAKVMGVALSVPMILGGIVVNADEAVVSCVPAEPEEETQSYETVVPGDQVFQEDYYVSGTRYGGQKYFYGLDTFVAPVSGNYYFVTSDEDDNYMYEVRSVEPEFMIDGTRSNNPGDFWNCYTVVHLEEGPHIISWQGYHPGGFTLTGTLLSADAPQTAVCDPLWFDSAVCDPLWLDSAVCDPLWLDSAVCDPLWFDSAVCDPLWFDSAVCDPLCFDPEMPEAPATPAAPASAAIDYSSIPVDIRMASIKNFIGHMYLEGLGRNIEDGALDYWVNQMFSEDITGTDIATQVLTSAEFSEKNLTDEEFVAVLNNVFGIENANDAQVLEALSQGASRESVIEQFAETSDWAAKCAFYYVNV